jgi:hypothetical protein
MAASTTANYRPMRNAVKTQAERIAAIEAIVESLAAAVEVRVEAAFGRVVASLATRAEVEAVHADIKKLEVRISSIEASQQSAKSVARAHSDILDRAAPILTGLLPYAMLGFLFLHAK